MLEDVGFENDSRKEPLRFEFVSVPDFSKTHGFNSGSVRKSIFSGSTRSGLRLSDASWLGPVRFGSVPRPVPASSRIRFGSVRFSRFGSVSYSFLDSALRLRLMYDYDILIIIMIIMVIMIIMTIMIMYLVECASRRCARLSRRNRSDPELNNTKTALSEGKPFEYVIARFNKISYMKESFHMRQAI